ncbi:hypothetical protein SG34_015120 [Thalassomonas viridans]|uniref:FAD-binding FR-type domain-containing protein n=1 Tax=Thalassomonas viridans TaxID=137584 RepID=A0AAF0C746_9GAMM|nr:membrane protein [Thalassomonas viridans]WDE02775.1 hypothetical protein SG34_015120 [Thalassomonas viridans]
MNNSIALALPEQQPLVKRLLKYPFLAHYQRLFLLVTAVNLYFLFNGIFSQQWWHQSGFALEAVSELMLINLTVAVLIRQQYVINALFWLATRAPTSWPLSIRWHLAKVYHFGGLHSGCATFATGWFFIYNASLWYYSLQGINLVSEYLLMLSTSLCGVLLLMALSALPFIRRDHHNLFEIVHRFGGWSVLAGFWLHTWLSISHIKGEQLTQSLAFWLLCLVSVSIVLPWLRLKKVPVSMTRPSSHVVLAKFDYGVTPFAGSSTAISRSPLTQWHAFANVPSPHESGFRLTISRAGDWTGELIDDLPSHLWVRGIPTAGVANIEVLFKRVVYIATGSGIGPCLPHLLANKVPALLVWATRDPRKTYGDELVDEILSVQPDAIIWNTQQEGKPDMVALAYRAYRQFNAEAVICISNQKLTNEVVFGMESRGIPAYGAIWDS